MNATVIVETVHGLKDMIVVGTGGLLATTNQVIASGTGTAKKTVETQPITGLPSQSATR